MSTRRYSIGDNKKPCMTTGGRKFFWGRQFGLQIILRLDIRGHLRGSCSVIAKGLSIYETIYTDLKVLRARDIYTHRRRHQGTVARVPKLFDQF